MIQAAGFFEQSDYLSLGALSRAMGGLDKVLDAVCRTFYFREPFAVSEELVRKGYDFATVRNMINPSSMWTWVLGKFLADPVWGQEKYLQIEKYLGAVHAARNEETCPICKRSSEPQS